MEHRIEIKRLRDADHSFEAIARILSAQLGVRVNAVQVKFCYLRYLKDLERKRRASPDETPSVPPPVDTTVRTEAGFVRCLREMGGFPRMKPAPDVNWRTLGRSSIERCHLNLWQRHLKLTR